MFLNILGGSKRYNAYDTHIIEQQTPEQIAEGKSASEAMGTLVDGYVIEMTLPLTEVDSILNFADGVSSEGDSQTFYIQNNDYRGLTAEAKIFEVAQKNSEENHILVKKNDESKDDSGDQNTKPGNDNHDSNNHPKAEKSTDSSNATLVEVRSGRCR